MSLGKELSCRVDEHGAIRVFDDGCKRYLCFGDNDEQSCQLKAEPGQLQHDYTRAMLLVLLFKQPKQVLVFGLGGGCLPYALHQLDGNIKLQVVELRQAVIDLAYQYFQLPRGKRLQVTCADINDYLQQGGHRQVDVLMSDLYDEHGVCDSQMVPSFIANCSRLLKDDGWLVLNCWLEHRFEQEYLEAIKAYFNDVRVCSTVSGNWIVIAGKQTDNQSQKQLKDKAQALSRSLGYSLAAMLKRLQQL